MTALLESWARAWPYLFIWAIVPAPLWIWVFVAWYL